MTTYEDDVAQRGRDADPQVLKGIEGDIKGLKAEIEALQKEAKEGYEGNQELILKAYEKLEDRINTLEHLVYKILGEEEPPEPEAIKIGWFRGIWLPSQSYRVGDVLRDSNGTRLCRKNVGPNQPMDAEHWV